MQLLTLVIALSLQSWSEHEIWYVVCVKVVEWILGPAEKLLASQTDIGDSFQAADELRKQHEQLELKCTVSTWHRHYCVMDKVIYW